jgi:hypothetical protein
MWQGSDSRKLQLWSDASGKEFAVRLSNEDDFKAVSNPDAKYAKLVDEAEYFSDMKYDWKFLLNHWAGVTTGSIKLVENNGKKNPEPLSFDLADMLESKEPKRRRARVEKPKPLWKCHYCLLSYNTEKERREHELTWHSEKLKKDHGESNKSI